MRAALGVGHREPVEDGDEAAAVPQSGGDGGGGDERVQLGGRVGDVQRREDTGDVGQVEGGVGERFGDGAAAAASSASALRGASLEPALERGRRFTRSPPREQAVHAHVLIQARPVDSLSFTDQPPLRALGRRPVQEPRIPRDRHGEAAPIGEVDDQRLVHHANITGAYGVNINR